MNFMFPWKMRNLKIEMVLCAASTAPHLKSSDPWLCLCVRDFLKKEEKSFKLQPVGLIMPNHQLLTAIIIHTLYCLFFFFKEITFKTRTLLKTTEGEHDD